MMGGVVATVTALSIFLLIGLLPVLYPTGTWLGRVWVVPTVVLVAGDVLPYCRAAAAGMTPGTGALGCGAPPWSMRPGVMALGKVLAAADPDGAP